MSERSEGYKKSFHPFQTLLTFLTLNQNMKCKTHKALSKRVKVTKSGKVTKKYCGQDHFNARDPGKITRKKRRSTSISLTHAKAFQILLPYSKIGK